MSIMSPMDSLLEDSCQPREEGRVRKPSGLDQIQGEPEMKIAFNTGRTYTEEGQQITAEKVGDVIVFVDHSRGIDGEIPLAKYAPDMTHAEMARHVLYMYDHGQFQYVGYEVLSAESKAVQLRLGYTAWQLVPGVIHVHKYQLL